MTIPLTLDFDALPPLSPRAIELLVLRIEDRDAEQQLQRIVSGEPQLAARIVAVANSAAVGLGKVRFATVPLALRRIGLRRAMQLSVAMLFGQPVGARLPAQMREDLWLHALALASAASELARMKRFHEPGEAYLAGLVHDLGYMLAELHTPGALSRMQSCAASQGGALEEAERQELGMDHAELTARLLEHWKVPAALVEVLRGHHGTGLSPDSLGAVLGCAERLVRLDALSAELYAGRKAHPFLGLTLDREQVEGDLSAQLGLGATEVLRTAERIGGRVAGLAGFAKAMAAA